MPRILSHSSRVLADRKKSLYWPHPLVYSSTTTDVSRVCCPRRSVNRVDRATKPSRSTRVMSRVIFFSAEYNLNIGADALLSFLRKRDPEHAQLARSDNRLRINCC